MDDSTPGRDDDAGSPTRDEPGSDPRDGIDDSPRGEPGGNGDRPGDGPGWDDSGGEGDGPPAGPGPTDPDGEGHPERDDPEGEWRFDVDEVDEDGIVRTTIEPGTPHPEHVLFVALGILAMLLVVGRIWLLV